MLLVSGGESDPNLQHFLARLRRRGVRHRGLLVGRVQNPRIRWELGNSSKFSVCGRAINPSAAFIRYDVFGHLSDPRASTLFRAAGWFSTIQAWLNSCDAIRMFNRDAHYPVLKPHVLMVARRLNIETPLTIVTNESRTRRRPASSDLIVKPVNGGDYCRPLNEVLRDTEIRRGAAATPAIIQEQIVGPDLRVYLAGGELFAFEIRSTHLDYREDPAPVVRYLPRFERPLGQKLLKLNRALGLDFSASDFKVCARTGTLTFLEVNSSPMFVAFDIACNGVLVNQMIDALVT